MVAADTNSHVAYTSFPIPAAQSNGSGVAEPEARDFFGKKKAAILSIVNYLQHRAMFLLQAAAAGDMPGPCWRTDGEFLSRFFFSVTDHPGGGDPCLSVDERDVSVWGDWGANSRTVGELHRAA